MKGSALSKLLGLAWVLALVPAPRQAAAAPASPYRTHWALLVGAGEFTSPAVPTLRFTGSDVDAMRRVLSERFGFAPDHIVSLVGPRATKEGIVQELSRLADRQRVSPDDAVLIYFTGHGQTVPLPRGGEMGFLIPHDAAVDLKDLDNPTPYYQTCIGMDEVRRLSALIPARHVLYLIDACYSGLAIDGRRGGKLPRALETVATRPARQLIVAGLKDEEAIEKEEWQHSAFTYTLLKGLESGAADCNRDGRILGIELATYLRDTVPTLAPNQTPNYASFDGEGEFILTPAEPAGAAAAADDSGPRILLTDPPDLAEGADEVLVRPLGDTATLKGIVAGAQAAVSLTIDGQPLALTPAQPGDLQTLLQPEERQVSRFEAEVPVAQGESKRVMLSARTGAGKEVSRRLLLRADAPDTRPPDVLVTELRVRDPAGAEVDWKSLAVASKGLMATSKSLAAVSKGIPAVSKALAVASKTVVVRPLAGCTYSIAGFACDDRAVVSVSIGDRPAQTRTATREELDGLGWPSGIAFEGAVNLARNRRTEVAVTAADAAGNREPVALALQPQAQAEPRILITDPPQTRGVRGTGLVLPRSADTLRVAGLVRADVPLRRVTVAGQAAQVRPATDADLAGTGWKLPASYFSATVPLRESSVTEYVAVEAEDASGARATRVVLAQRPGSPVRLRVEADTPRYRIGAPIHFHISADRDCYAYLLHREPDGSLALFLPNDAERDSHLPGGTRRVFPDPALEARWQGQYALVARGPAGTDTLYCLAVPHPLPGSMLESLTSFQALGKAVTAVGRTRGSRLVLPQTVGEDAIRKAAEDLGGAWAVLKYEVVR